MLTIERDDKEGMKLRQRSMMETLFLRRLVLWGNDAVRRDITIIISHQILSERFPLASHLMTALND